VNRHTNLVRDQQQATQSRFSACSEAGNQNVYIEAGKNPSTQPIYFVFL
jgi:hypothetical protein